MQLIRLLQCIQCGKECIPFTGSFLPPSWPFPWSFFLEIGSPKVLSRIFLTSQVDEVLKSDTLLQIELCDTSCSILFGPQTLYNYLSLKMETHWASFFKRSINIYINSLYLLKAKSLKFSIDILNHKNIFLLYYINLNAILNHKNKLLLFFLRKKSSNTIFYFHMLFIYLFLSLPFCLFLLWNSLVSLPLHLIISLPMKARHY